MISKDRERGRESDRLERSGTERPSSREQPVAIPFGASAAGPGELEGTLSTPTCPRGLVIFVHESGANRHSLRDGYVAEALQRAGFATLLFDLLTPAESAEDDAIQALRFDVELLTGRVVAALRWVTGRAITGSVGCFGADTGAAAALAAAALRPELVSAVVARGGRPDLVDPPVLGDVRAPVLLIAGELDEELLTLSRMALGHLPNAELTLIPGARHLSDDPVALAGVAERAREWFQRHLDGAGAPNGGS
jgi:putative phosphoribosyl transferase